MMPDWEALVGEQLGELSLAAEERQEVIAELAAHLEELFDGLLRQGVAEQEALRRTLSQAGNWGGLRRKLQAARTEEKGMTNRVKQFWLPGFLTLFISMVLLMAMQFSFTGRDRTFVGSRPLVVGKLGWGTAAPVAVIYLPWLLSLLPIGAMGAYLSSRAGASKRTIFLSIVFPMLPYLAIFLIAFPVALVLDDHVAHNVMLSALFVGLLAWVVLPGAALLVGGLPVFLLCSRRLSFQSVSTQR